ncbi:MAG: tetratricopeptide repeat protein [Myxococcota bacterium]
MARKTRTPGLPDALANVESAGERMAAWVAANARAVLIGAGVVLATAAALGGYRSWHEGREDTASSALERVRGAYLEAMGADPGSLVVPELANPSAARAIRVEYADRFREVAVEQAGTVAGTLAQLEAGDLFEASGQPERAVEAWREAAATAPRNSALRGVVLQRVATAEEEAGLWAEAGATHEAAAQIRAFPPRYWALLDAARCFAQAGEVERARELFARVDAEAPDLRVPDHLRALARELRAGGSP